ncbi:MAG: hydroxypyruvate reductase [Thermodesulfobacteriota bacterium]|nr:MAG: hydroxypyruvate reductase [Thermodesulfobacteriota bacterium]
MSSEKLRSDAREIFEAGLKAVDPINAVKNHIKRDGNKLRLQDVEYELGDYENIYVVGMGKAAASMAKAIEEVLGDKLTHGIVNVKYGHTAPLNKIKTNEAAHPVPDEAGIAGSKEIIELLKKTSEKDLVICLISGGGSALLPSPAGNLTLEDKQAVTKALLECGADIHEINSIRKQISAVKGGRLAALVYPSRLISLILSDVIGDDLDVIASGPTVPDTHTFHDCRNIIEKYKLDERVPKRVIDYIEKGCDGEIEDTPKADSPVFESTQNIVVGSNIIAVSAAKEKASELGYNTLVLSTFIHGETEEVAKVHTAIVKEIKSSGNPVKKPACIISGGETTVTIEGKGLGGRNQEFVLAAAIDIEGLDNTIVLSGGTDGNDGPTDAAGAIADGTTINRAGKLGLNAYQHLCENNSYNFFKPLGDLLITGPTNTNVMDLRVLLVS